ncbi:hypothetical protein FA15DRAFT_704686 [Coprinopsis marcescibilis]|uniref:Uncharacterized protein n=1 Tax=Coprinopsis marcescibilis TaxID=230819 RepID=A0A5C3L7X7_COPMA|nr:hypothetical protein FA15DRAFT_704686 [Coprinopsis marcescibilis]
MGSDAPPAIDPVFQLGPSLLGSQLTFLLFGAFLVQLYSYIINSSVAEKGYAKILVTFVTIAELLSILIICNHAWHVLISNKEIKENHRLSATAPFYTVLNRSSLCFQGLFSWYAPMTY